MCEPVSSKTFISGMVFVLTNGKNCTRPLDHAYSDTHSHVHIKSPLADHYAVAPDSNLKSGLVTTKDKHHPTIHTTVCSLIPFSLSFKSLINHNTSAPVPSCFALASTLLLTSHTMKKTWDSHGGISAGIFWVWTPYILVYIYLVYHYTVTAGTNYTSNMKCNK
jgi:hypothetical protein